MDKGLSSVFTFWIEQLNKLIVLFKKIPVFEKISLFDTIIALGLIAIFIKVIKYGFHFRSLHTSGTRNITGERSD